MQWLHELKEYLLIKITVQINRYFANKQTEKRIGLFILFFLLESFSLRFKILYI